MSLTNANIIKLATNKTPILIECSRKFSEIGDPLTFSIAIISNCPPSRTGMGNKFIRPRFILKIAIIDKKSIRPDFAAEPANTEICIGPPILSAETEPFISFPIDERINCVNL